MLFTCLTISSSRYIWAQEVWHEWVANGHGAQGGVLNMCQPYAATFLTFENNKSSLPSSGTQELLGELDLEMRCICNHGVQALN